jgi:hypothetical protein
MQLLVATTTEKYHAQRFVIIRMMHFYVPDAIAALASPDTLQKPISYRLASTPLGNDLVPIGPVILSRISVVAVSVFLANELVRLANADGILPSPLNHIEPHTSSAPGLITIAQMRVELGERLPFVTFGAMPHSIG